MTTLNLPAAHVLNVQTDVGSSAVVLRLSDLPGGGDPLASTSMGANVSATFGPYAKTTRFDLQPLTGRLAYNMALSVNEPVEDPTPAPVPAPPPPAPTPPTPPTPPAPAPAPSQGGGEHGSGHGDTELGKTKDTLPGPPSWSRAP